MKFDINNLDKYLVKAHDEKAINELSQDFGSYSYDPKVCTGSTVCLIVGDSIVFIQRSETMPSHKGQIAFIGGHKKDGENCIQTAEREFEEETSLSIKEIEILGVTPPVFTSFDAQVIPVVAKYKGSSEGFLDRMKSNGEWDDAFLVPIKCFWDEFSWKHAWRYSEFSNGSLLFHSIIGGKYEAKFNNKKNRLLWGATARMVWNLLRMINKGIENE